MPLHVKPAVHHTLQASDKVACVKSVSWGGARGAQWDKDHTRAQGEESPSSGMSARAQVVKEPLGYRVKNPDICPISLEEKP